MNVNEISSKFQFLGNRIVEFSIKTDNSSPGRLHINTDIDYNVKSIKEKEDLYLGFLELIINIQGVATNDTYPLIVNLVIEGCFTANKEDLDMNTFKDMVEKNGLVALSQIARSYLISATSLSGINPPIKLPMINVFSLIKKKKMIKNAEDA
ncbi:preprotein translocase subunit SecB [Clostridium algidicarnis]|uniref:Preprotein translocase subunit SecB n=1 Tax=Clostridium algidicarnis DSM 15099 TaxID=1121295 RepID=A0A2S6FXP8_9CLOT|nr:preprotein translocase subunit SecB [Clostridium algidicarnis]MBU3210046.1 preprotein translocase subunit SecB [Clostridium algidicarnis]PPK48355.1 hypothetical protein BD821_108116 [Clostridium algidicarnis DSM 15099]